MNGFISKKALRFTLVASACLLSGFVSGANFPDFNLDKIFPQEEINYSKISWISSAFEGKTLSLATVDYPASPLANQEIKLAEFHLPTKKFFAKKARPLVHRRLAKLIRVPAPKKEFDIFKDYRVALARMNFKFQLAMTAPAQQTETLVVAQSSADPVLDLPYTVEALKTEKVKVSSNVVKLKKKQLNTQKLSIQLKQKPHIIEQTPVQVIPDVAETAVITSPIVMNTEPAKVKMVRSAPELKTSIQSETTVDKDEVLGHALENKLLEQHIHSYQARISEKQKLQYAVQAPKRYTPQVANPDDQIDHSNDVQNFTPPATKEDGGNTSACKILPKMHLMRPQPTGINEDTQVCPTQQAWISKSWGDEGWVKADVDGFFPVLTYYPHVTSAKTLLLDQNSVALLAIRSGIHYAHGTGMILGSVPPGYKVEFSGRAEEAQYFDLESKKYFILMNVEPGAGVIEVVSEKNQNENASVFTPVLSETVTYLDLGSPVSANIPVKIVKATSAAEDVAGLTVGISTQTQIQAITQANGLAVLKNVRLIPGYPVFVDVSSKLNGERSYQYRYQLNKRTRTGVFVLKQYPEKQVHQWLRQVQGNISDQSGMIFGQFNRKRLDGFRKHYGVKVESLAEKFGLVSKSFTILWDEKLSEKEPLEGDLPRFLSVQVPEGLAQAHLVNENNQIVQTSLIPVSPRVINVISE